MALNFEAVPVGETKGARALVVQVGEQFAVQVQALALRALREGDLETAGVAMSWVVKVEESSALLAVEGSAAAEASDAKPKKRGRPRKDAPASAPEVLPMLDGPVLAGDLEIDLTEEGGA
jgi:hypothetical protein